MARWTKNIALHFLPVFSAKTGLSHSSFAKVGLFVPNFINHWRQCSWLKCRNPFHLAYVLIHGLDVRALKLLVFIYSKSNSLHKKSVKKRNTCGIEIKFSYVSSFPTESVSFYSFTGIFPYELSKKSKKLNGNTKQI